MSKAVYNHACLCKMRPSVKAVLKELAWYADDNGCNCWPSVGTVALRTSLTKRAVQKALRTLENEGAIKAVGSRLGGRSHSTRYRIDLGWLQQRANHVHPSVIPRRNSEERDVETMNQATPKGEPEPPEHKEHEIEKKAAIPVDEGRAQGSYRSQRVRQSAKKVAYQRTMPDPLTDHEREARLLELKRQGIQLLSKAVEAPS